ncbi:MAG: GNAT family N-acetyltransferase [Phycisphaeraceae bacterium]|nr:GNAT family N-acetyltransferase [Phycisphaeraceae bacterium]
MLHLRCGTLADFDFLYQVDVEDEGISVDFKADWTEKEWESHRQRIRSLLSDDHAATFILEDADSHCRVGVVCGFFRNIDRDTFPYPTGFGFLSRDIFPHDGRFCEVYQLWVDPAYRRRGLGSALKCELEYECLRRGVGLIYTHTESANKHVIALNHRLGYRCVRVGPIWDDVERVSLVKDLRPA